MKVEDWRRGSERRVCVHQFDLRPSRLYSHSSDSGVKKSSGHTAPTLWFGVFIPMDTVRAASLAKCCHVTNEHVGTVQQEEVRNRFHFHLCDVRSREGIFNMRLCLSHDTNWYCEE